MRDAGERKLKREQNVNLQLVLQLLLQLLLLLVLQFE
jgi:hypothetical protein